MFQQACSSLLVTENSFFSLDDIYNELRRSDGFILCNETKTPNPLETVGWGILIYLTSEIISELFRFLRFLQQWSEELVGIALLRLHHVFRCAGKEKFAATSTTFWTHVDEPVCQLDDIQIVLDDDDRVATVYQLLQYVHQDADVLEVETGGWLVQDVERLARVSLREFCGEFYTLTFTAR